MLHCRFCGALLPPDCTVCPNCEQEQPPERRPLSVIQCLGVLLAALIPIIGLIPLLCWALGPDRVPGRRALARALLAVILLVSLLVLGAFARGSRLLYQSYDMAPPEWEAPYPEDLPEDWEYWEEYEEPYWSWDMLPREESSVHPLARTGQPSYQRRT